MKITKEKCFAVLLSSILIFCVITLAANFQKALLKIGIELQKEAEKEEALKERRHQDMIKAIRESGR